MRVAVWPLGALFLLACVLGIFSTDDIDELEIGWGTRMRVVLAALLQGVGGGFTVEADGSVGFAGGGDRVAGEASLSWVPLLATAVWVGLLVAAARRARRHETQREGWREGRQGPSQAAATAGLESALRTGALCAVGAFAFALYAQPSYEGMGLSSAPGLTLLWSFLLSTAVVAVVLTRRDVDARLAARPPASGPGVVLGALRTALLALVLVVALASAVMFVVALTTSDDLTAAGVVWLLAVLPNLGALALGMAWGAPVDIRWNLPELDAGRESFGYSDLADAGGAWSVVGALAGGLACALILGLLAVRRSADRREQFLAAGFFVLALLTIVALAGVTMDAGFHEVTGDGGGDGYGGGFGDGSGGGGAYADSYTMSGEFTAAGAEMLLFTLLWSFGGVLVAPYVLGLFRRGGGATAVAGVRPQAAPYAAYPQDGAYAPTQTGLPPHAPGEVLSDKDTPGTPGTPGTSGTPGTPGPRRGPGTKWTALIVAAFLVGGAATAGVLLLNRDDGDGDGRTNTADEKPAGQRHKKKPEPSPSASGEDPYASESPAQDPDAVPSPGASTGPGRLPAGYAMVEDPEGFEVAVKEGWEREAEGSQIDYAPSFGIEYLRIGIIEDAEVTSYDNFRSMEKKAKKRDDYERLELRENTFRGHPGARWEFTYTSDDGETVHATDQAYVADDGTEYSIYTEREDFGYGSGEGDGAGPDTVFETALATWTEPGADG